MSQSQKEFEVWASQYEYDLSWSEVIDSYAIMRTRIVWEAWQASRASLAVELKRHLTTAMDSAGVKYKLY
jgi:hypothetical protein